MIPIKISQILSLLQNKKINKDRAKENERRNLLKLDYYNL